jgi:hypothetical protein
MHALPITAPFKYTDVIALNIAAVLAAALTSIWAYRDLDSIPQPKDTQETAQSMSKTHYQRRIGTVLRPRASSDYPHALENIAPRITSRANTDVSAEVTALLETSFLSPNKTLPSMPWSSKLIQQTTEMWRDGSISINLPSRQSFLAAGLGDTWSCSAYNGAHLQITAGFLNDADITLYVRDRPRELACL